MALANREFPNAIDAHNFINQQLGYTDDYRRNYVGLQITPLVQGMNYDQIANCTHIVRFGDGVVAVQSHFPHDFGAIPQNDNLRAHMHIRPVQLIDCDHPDYNRIRNTAFGGDEDYILTAFMHKNNNVFAVVDRHNTIAGFPAHVYYNETSPFTNGNNFNGILVDQNNQNMQTWAEANPLDLVSPYGNRQQRTFEPALQQTFSYATAINSYTVDHSVILQSRNRAWY